jgi:hypothetical protein
MKLFHSLKLTLALSLACLVSLPANSAELKKGKKVWSKHYETVLLTEPSPLAPASTTVGFAEKLSIREVRGTWLRVKSGKDKGWVFQGNVATEKPSYAPGAGFTTIDASQTDSVAAARPLSPAAEGYAERRGAEDAHADINWLDVQADAITQDDLIVFMQVEQLGEYRE